MSAPHTEIPAGPYRGGFGVVCLHDGAGSAVATRLHAASPLAVESERVTVGTGVQREIARATRWTPPLYDPRALAWLAQVADEGGSVYGLGLALGLGRHVVWDEPVPPLSDRLGGEVGSLVGASPLFESHATDAAVYESPSLLAASRFASPTGGGAWTAENAGSSSWTSGGDPLTGRTAPRYRLDPDSGTAHLWAQAVVPGVPGLAGQTLRASVAFGNPTGGSGTQRLSIQALTYASRDAAQASIATGATATLARVSADLEDFVGGAEMHADLTIPSGTWAVRVAVEASGDMAWTAYAPRLTTVNTLTGSLL